MRKKIYISADYAINNGDRDVVDILQSWGNDNKHNIDYVDTAKVVSGSIAYDEDCRPCDLKDEFNKQINVSSAVIFIIGDKTKMRTAGSSCNRLTEGEYCSCTPYKQNAKGSKVCKINSLTFPGDDDDIGNINQYSYLQHEFLQAQKKKKKIIILYNSLYKKESWLPNYMQSYCDKAEPFWIINAFGKRRSNYDFIKKSLDYE